jgi:hypothetical protein
MAKAAAALLRHGRLATFQEVHGRPDNTDENGQDSQNDLKQLG